VRRRRRHGIGEPILQKVFAFIDRVTKAR